MAASLSVEETADIALIEQARKALQGFTATKEELIWRITHQLKTADKTRKAVEQLLDTASLGQFQSRADDCACDYAAARPDNAFPGYESPIDVFYGSSLQVPSRVDQWRDAWPPRWETARQRQGRRCTTRLTLLDKSLLRDLRHHAEAFMRAVRALPGFQKAWNGKQLRSGFLRNDSLNEREAKFRKKYATVSQLLLSTPMAPEDIYGIALCMRRMLPASVVHYTLRFLDT
ncbi:MAG: hypothetical protein CMJ62_06235 [Planctomycetaceae bacterium]|nr:hypothetical protein [Planctomycetaceae bacterium]